MPLPTFYFSETGTHTHKHILITIDTASQASDPLVFATGYFGSFGLEFGSLVS